MRVNLLWIFIFICFINLFLFIKCCYWDIC